MPPALYYSEVKVPYFVTKGKSPFLSYEFSFYKTRETLEFSSLFIHFSPNLFFTFQKYGCGSYKWNMKRLLGGYIHPMEVYK
jgi:hypothetical protein